MRGAAVYSYRWSRPGDDEVGRYFCAVSEGMCLKVDYDGNRAIGCSLYDGGVK
ncbi:hypothetical protein [Ruegeria arenilitoris]|uniref:hypothetical protein n=1 Tax=Ruegeria arenilitoris TaxID=1173585 RepID=UPI001480B303|nr:hypothetical protein [Ruegeria arenilitoris]